MSLDTSLTVSHFGICVSNLERSLRFYTEGLGFELDHCIDVGAPFDRLTELPELVSRAAFLRRGDSVIELLSYERPGVVGPAERRPMNQLGLTHMSLVVGDLQAIVGRIDRYGGQVHAQTRVDFPLGSMIFCTDPDGMRIELWQKAEG
jgi:lactoylglutathione lyase